MGTLAIIGAITAATAASFRTKSDASGKVVYASLFGVIPLFRRDVNGRATIFGMHTKRLDSAK